MKTSYIVGIIIFILVAIFSAYWYIRPSTIYKSQPSTNPTTSDVVVPTEPNQNKTGEINIDIKNYKFNPETITISKGTKVTWTNNDSVPHLIKSDSDVVFKSSRLDPGQTFSFIFTNIGIINYHCEIHPTMKASITVE